MPKFDISNNIDLIDDLKNLGVTDIFDYKKADFSPLTKESNELYVSSAEHAVRVITDECGSRAAAYCNFRVGGSHSHKIPTTTNVNSTLYKRPPDGNVMHFRPEVLSY